MGDDVTREAPRRSACGSVCLGFGLLVLVALGALLILNARASSRFGARVDALKDDIAAVRKSLGDGTRPVLWGSPVSGNAVDDYNALEWVFGPRSDWTTTPPPGLPGTDFPMGGADQRFPGWLADVVSTLQVGYGDPQAGPAARVRPEAAAVVSALLPLTRHVRDGLRRERCQWPFEIERGAATPIPNLIALRTGANLLAIEAQRASPDDAVRIALEIVAFGQDVGRTPLLIGTMIGVAIKGVGLKALEHALRRPVTRESYASVVATLDRIGAIDLAAGMTGERLCMGVELAKLGGRPLAPTATQPGLEAGVMSAFALYLDHEWEGFDAAHRLLLAQMTAPYAQHAARQAELDAFLQGSWYVIAAIAIPNLSEARAAIDEAVARQAALRVLAAAHLHRLDHQAFPARLEDLQAALGGALPMDPFRDGAAPLTLRLADGELRCYSWWRDGDDDQGVQRAGNDASGDIGAGTRAP